MISADYLKIQEGDYIGWTCSEYLALPEKAADKDQQKREASLNRLETQLSNMVLQLIVSSVGLHVMLLPFARPLYNPA